MMLAFPSRRRGLALDLVDLDAAELAADVGLLVAVGVALVQVPIGNTALTAILLLALVISGAAAGTCRHHALRVAYR